MNEQAERILLLMDVFEGIRQDEQFVHLTPHDWILAMSLFVPNLLAQESSDIAAALDAMAMMETDSTEEAQ